MSLKISKYNNCFLGKTIPCSSREQKKRSNSREQIKKIYLRCMEKSTTYLCFIMSVVLKLIHMNTISKFISGTYKNAAN